MDKNFDNDFQRTTNVLDFKNLMNKKVPKGYPICQPTDEYTRICFNKSYEERKAAFIDFALKSPSTDTTKGFFYELIRIFKNHAPINENAIFGALDYINSRKDCADFMLTGILRLYYQFREHPLVSKELLTECKQTILGFKYWPDEPGIDSMCYWTENHHMLFSTCEYLAGHLFPNEVFINSGQTGRQKIERGKNRIEKWLELRFKTGFSEWLSNVYFDESMPPLIQLFDLAPDEELKANAKDIIDLMLYDMALNSYYGQFSCTHGRTYTMEKLNPLDEDTIDTSKLIFGQGKFTNKNNMATVLFALSSYEVPEAIIDLANDSSTLENRQRVSIKFKDARKWGYHKLNTESAMGLLSFGGYSHPRTFNHLALMLEKFKWWENKFFLELKPFKRLIQVGRFIRLTNLVAYVFRKDMSRNAMTEANLYTYRTPDYMLSTAQDYRKSYGGDQHHIWQATLDNQAVVFSTHPGGYGESAPDAYWHGNGFMPKSVQYKNINISIYNTPKPLVNLVIGKVLDFTHLFFPKERFNEVIEKNNWIFGRSNDGYIAVRSMNPYTWAESEDWKNKELIVAGKKNIYITELGSTKEYKSFDDFIHRVSNAKVEFTGLNVNYQSPSLGKVTTGWKKAMKVNGTVIPTRNYKRYENKTSATPFASDIINIKHGTKSISIKRIKK